MNVAQVHVCLDSGTKKCRALLWDTMLTNSKAHRLQTRVPLHSCIFNAENATCTCFPSYRLLVFLLSFAIHPYSHCTPYCLCIFISFPYASSERQPTKPSPSRELKKEAIVAQLISTPLFNSMNIGRTPPRTWRPSLTHHVRLFDRQQRNSQDDPGHCTYNHP